MRKPKLHAAHWAGNADEVEAAFYAALQDGDLDRLMACWADEDEIVCIQPGGARAVGAAAIRAGFEALLAQAGAGAQPERVRKLETLGGCVHSVVERSSALASDTGAVLATHVYFKTVQGWRLLARHASPCPPGEADESMDPPQVLH